jgi:hypothetical protein
MLPDEVILSIHWSFLIGIKYEGPGHSSVTLYLPYSTVFQHVQ